MRLPLVTASLKPEPDTPAEGGQAQRQRQVRGVAPSARARRRRAGGNRSGPCGGPAAPRRRGTGRWREGPERPPIDRREPPRVMGVIENDVAAGGRVRFDDDFAIAVRDDLRCPTLAVMPGLGP